ncbi:MAG: hypothetical protein DRQ46_01585 [Gammaproteobacteria bacterium]|nr:MAG: hypothetical protein DRQ46_01585 [Gammaproteobacteria bacterium]
MSEGCGNCGGDGKCTEHSAIETQMDTLKELPNTVSKLTGIVSVIAGLFALLVGLAFNAHFEQIHQSDNMVKRLDAFGVQISAMGAEHNLNKQRLGERLVRIETQIESVHRSRSKTK